MHGQSKAVDEWAGHLVGRVEVVPAEHIQLLLVGTHGGIVEVTRQGIILDQMLLLPLASVHSTGKLASYISLHNSYHCTTHTVLSTLC
jgi:hypothetical protein